MKIATQSRCDQIQFIVVCVKMRCIRFICSESQMVFELFCDYIFTASRAKRSDKFN